MLIFNAELKIKMHQIQNLPMRNELKLPMKRNSAN